jgi:uncharacterized protein (DUF488 family)
VSDARPPAPTLYTIGHSNHSLERFLELLRANHIEVLADVRSRPYSKYSSHFSREPLAAALADAGIVYEFFGRELGGQPNGPDNYDERGRALYWKMAQTESFRNGLARLRATLEGRTTAMMCSEEDPSMCHRRHLITRVLVEDGVDVLHIRGTGIVESEEAVREREATADDNQLPLFEEDERERERLQWKSIQSGLQKNPPPNFSAP